VDESRSSEREWAGVPAQIDQLVDEGQLQSALRLGQDLVAWSEARSTGNPTAFAQHLMILADVYRRMRRLTDAAALYEQAVKVLSTSGDRDTTVSTALNGWATSLIGMADYASAEPLLRRALQIDKNTVGEGSDYYSETLSNLGMLKFNDGKYAEAEPLLRRTLEIRQQLHPDDDLSVAESLTNLAALYQVIDDAKAEKLFERALRIRRRLGKPMDVARALNNLALYYRVNGRYREAERLYQEALGIYRSRAEEDPISLTVGLNNLAGLYFARGDYKSAEPLVQQVVTIRRSLGEEAWAFGSSLNNLAAIYHRTGRYEAAERHYKEAIAAWRRIVGDHHPRLRTALSNLSGLYVAMKRPNAALELMREVIGIGDRLITNVFAITSENQRLLYMTSFQQDLDDLVSLVARHFAGLIPVVAETLDLVLRRKGIVAESMAARRDDVLSGKYPSLESKMRELRTLRMKLADCTVAGPVDDDLEHHVSVLNQLAESTERLESALASEVPELSLAQRLSNADRRHVALAMAAGSVLVEFVRFTDRHFPAGLPSDSSTRYGAFVVEAGKPDAVRFIDLGQAEAIDSAVTAFRQSLSRPPGWLTNVIERAGVRLHRRYGKALRAIILDPLGVRVDGNGRLFIAPEGTLAWIPFEALPTEHGFLVEQFAITYLSVGRDLIRFESDFRPPFGAAVVLADPNFDLRARDELESAVTDRVPHEQAQVIRAFPSAAASASLRERLRSAVWRFPSLPGTRTEAQGVSERLGVRPRLGDAALESELKACQSPQVLHLATHGFFLPNQPHTDPEGGTQSGVEWSADSKERLSGFGMENPLLRSGLALAGANTWLAYEKLPPAAEDGILNGVDVSALDLSGTDLAVLSACDTALGSAHAWEGVFGLRRAFTLAGARTLVMSLWNVSDRQTSDLMLDFYKRLLTGMSCGEALREAQLALKEDYPNPYYWAAFICQGDPGPIRPARNRSADRE
jgi:CHAT domain-containing protein/tetratricopeptide (TPR) repeat protein